MTIDIETLSDDEITEDIEVWSWLINERTIQWALTDRVLAIVQDFARDAIDELKQEKRKRAIEARKSKH